MKKPVDLLMKLVGRNDFSGDEMAQLVKQLVAFVNTLPDHDFHPVRWPANFPLATLVDLRQREMSHLPEVHSLLDALMAIAPREEPPPFDSLDALREQARDSRLHWRLEGALAGACNCGSHVHGIGPQEPHLHGIHCRFRVQVEVLDYLQALEPILENQKQSRLAGELK
jgi:hypothetical protein